MRIIMGKIIHLTKWVRLLVLACLTVAFVLPATGCASWDSGDDGRYSIVCTTFPQYDWVRQVIKGNENRFNVRLLLKNGTDMHSYQPSTEDMYRIATADIFIYVGGESDAWVEKVLANAKNDNIRTINMMELLGDKTKVEELVEGMQEGQAGIAGFLGAFTGGHGDHGHEHEEEEEYDEHVWLSLENAALITADIARNISQLDAAMTASYESNASDYIKQLDALDDSFRTVVDGMDNPTLLFGDRFPFRYFADDYGIEYYAAFPGCSAETEASFTTITYLSGKVDELGLKAIYVIENSDTRVAETIRKNTKNKDQQIVVLNSMQSVSDDDIAAGASYLGIMQDNLRALSTQQ